MALAPGKTIENTIRIIDTAFRYSNTTYWLYFGALWALCQNNGTIPDEDFDVCVHYGADWRKIKRSFEQFGYTMSKAMLADNDRENIVYCGFNKQGSPHICCSFWYLHDGIRYYCHDQLFELKSGDVRVPPSGYWFKGVPDFFVKDASMFRRVEWPGIRQAYKIMVPMLPALDYLYPCWPYIKQRFQILHNEIDIEKKKSISIYRHGAISPYMVHVKSMTQWHDAAYIKQQLTEGKKRWDLKLKEMKNA